MLHILETGAPPGAHAVLRAMFAARKSVFVDLLGWDVPVLDDRYEVDQFDGPDATYLVLTEADGRHLASARLLPTARPHILGDVFPELCQTAPPRGPGIVEISRFCLDRRLNAAQRRRVRDQLVIALVRHALAANVSSYTAMAELGWYQQILAFGWRCEPLGLPHAIGGRPVAALRIQIDEHTPALLAAAGIVQSGADREPDILQDAA